MLGEKVKECECCFEGDDEKAPRTLFRVLGNLQALGSWAGSRRDRERQSARAKARGEETG